MSDSVPISSKLLSTVGDLYKFSASQGVDGYLVGGAVRDSLLGRRTLDFDVVADADTVVLGRQLARSLDGRFVLMDSARGIVRILLPGSDDDPRIVDLKPMHGGILEDLQERDFTCDAMAVTLADAAAGRIDAGVIDPHDGLPDLRSGLIREVGPTVFSDDPAKAGVDNLLQLYELATGEGRPAIEEHFAGKGYGDLKSEVAEALIEELRPIRGRYRELMADTAELDALTARGAERARSVAEPKLKVVKERVGFIVP